MLYSEGSERVIEPEALIDYGIQSVERDHGAPSLFALGSIFHQATNGSTIWGTGINPIWQRPRMQVRCLDIRAVRGPLTKRYIRDTLGLAVPDIYGDPALLMPQLFPEFRKSQVPKYPYSIFVQHNDEPYIQKNGSPDIKVGRSPGRSDQELCDLGRNRLIHGFFWDLPEQYFLASVDGRLRRPRSGWGACSAAAKSRRKVFNLWLLLDDRWAGDTAQVVPVR